MSETIVHQNPWYSVSLREDQSGRWFRVVRPDSSMVIATTPNGDYVMILGQRDTIGDGDYYEFPCGAVEVGEAIEVAGVRETVEETGHTVEGLRKIGEFVEAPGISASVCHVFLAVSTGVTSQRLDANERWEVEIVGGDRINGLVAEGRIRDGGTLAAIYLLGVHGAAV